MGYRLIDKTKFFIPFEYNSEADFEKVVNDNSEFIFGKQSLYFSIKKKIGDDIVTIPDGYLLDFKFHNDPRLYMVEIELVNHDPFGHIGQQLLKFAIAYKTSGYKIKKLLQDQIENNPSYLQKISSYITGSDKSDLSSLLDFVIYEKPVATIVIIDQLEDKLEKVLAQLTMQSDIIEFETYYDGKDKIHRFTPFQDDLIELDQSTTDLDVLDTIVVPAQEDGFNRVFVGENCWYEIRISSAMIDKIKYIAAYQVAPISSITHVAEVAKIERYEDTNKYIVYFKKPAIAIAPIKMKPGIKGQVPQAPRYTIYQRLISAKNLIDAFPPKK
jgi:hypothetical protein